MVVAGQQQRRSSASAAVGHTVETLARDSPVWTFPVQFSVVPWKFLVELPDSLLGMVATPFSSQECWTKSLCTT